MSRHAKIRFVSGSIALFIIAAVGIVGDRPPKPAALADPARLTRPAPLTVQAIDVLFSPKGGCTDRIVQELGAARKSIRVQAYSFTSAKIAKAVVDAKRRGVVVDIILDKSQQSERYSSSRFLMNEGVPVLIDSKHQIAHNKIMVIDDRIVITGSFNFTKAAEESNAENLLVIDSASLAVRYIENFEAHRKHAKPPKS